MGLQRRTQYVPCDAPLLDELCIVDSSSTTTAGPLATSQPTQNAPDDGGLSPGKYFYVIPAILIVGIAIGLSIFVRRIVQRRRRRFLEEAVAAGILLPEQMEALEKGIFVSQPTKPHLWEVNAEKQASAGNEDLKDILPLSATIIPGHSSSSSGNSGLASYISRHIRSIFSSRRAPGLPPIELPPENLAPASPDQLQIAVLISLPSKRSEMHASYEPQKEKERKGREEDVGELVFGVTEFPWGSESEARKTS